MIINFTFNNYFYKYEFYFISVVILKAFGFTFEKQLVLFIYSVQLIQLYSTYYVQLSYMDEKIALLQMCLDKVLKVIYCAIQHPMTTFRTWKAVFSLYPR